MISVIIPVYNNIQFLPRCINSVLEQHVSDIEVILIDDGSTDGSGLLCDRYAEIDQRIYVIHTENNGAASARNIGLKFSKGQYVAFVDSDDFVSARMFSELLKCLYISGADISACGFICCDDSLKQDISFVYDSDYIIIEGQNIIIRRNDVMVMPWNKLYRKEILENILFPDGKLVEDEFFFNRLVEKKIKIALTKSKLYAYSIRYDSTMGKNNLKRFSYAREALDDRLRVCDVNKWGYAFESVIYNICEYTIDNYFWLRSMNNGDASRIANELFDWCKQVVRKKNCSEIPLSFRMFLLSPRLYLSMDKIRKRVFTICNK